MDKPIFLIGCPRSGTTILLRLIAAHEELAWVSRYVNKLPKRLSLTLLNRVYDLHGTLVYGGPDVDLHREP